MYIQYVHSGVQLCVCIEQGKSFLRGGGEHIYSRWEGIYFTMFEDWLAGWLAGCFSVIAVYTEETVSFSISSIGLIHMLQ